MAGLLPWQLPGGIVYNGFAFNGSTHTEAFAITHELDAAKRTIAASRFDVTFKTMLVAQPTDALVVNAVQRLSQPGMPLVIAGRGIPTALNLGRVRDVRWGPMPLGTNIVPLGQGNACWLIWRVAFTIPTCSDARFGGPLEFSWSATYALDRGYTTRTIAGRLKIAQNRVRPGARAILDSPDAYLENITPPLIPGYNRTFLPREINDAKDELAFGFVDDEWKGPNFPPEWVVDVDASEDTESTAEGLKTWGSTISASYDLSAAAPDKWVPVAHFLGVHVRDRIEAQARALGRVGKDNAKSIIPLAFRMSNPDVYHARQATFSLSWRFTCSIRDIFQASDLWRPMPGSSWRRWAASLADDVFGPRGFAEMSLGADQDSIVDLCGSVPTVGLFSRPPSVPLPDDGPSVVGFPTRPPRNLDDSVLTTKPDPDESWVSYTTEIFCEWDSGATPVRTLPTKLLDGTADIAGAVSVLMGAPWDALDAVGGLPGVVGGGVAAGSAVGRGKLDAVEVQRRAKPIIFLYLRGKAARYGFKVPIPRLVKVNGVECVDACRLDRNEGFSQGITFAAGTSPVYLAKWNLRYALAASSLPKELPVPPNPMMADAGK